MDYIIGSFKKYIFNGNNGYVVGLFKVKDASSNYKDYINTTITFTGYFHELNENDTYKLFGTVSNHNKYGEQFICSSYERVMPEEKDSIVEFLSGGLFKGIGKKKAERIVSVLGEKTLEIILNNPDNLLLIPTVTKKNIDTLYNTLLEYESSYNTILKLTEIGFSTKNSMIIYNKFKQNIINIIDNDIYKIYFEIKDISFKQIDKIALNNSYTKDDERRITACIYYVLEELTNTIGNSYFSIDEIYYYTKRALNIELIDSTFIDCLNKLILDLKVVKDKEKYYLKNIYDSEEYIVKRIRYLMNLDDLKYKNLDKYINSLELINNISYDDNQLIAIKNAIIKNFLVITGGPGSGKTTITKSIVNLYRDINKLTYDKMTSEVALLAPTGREEKRLSEATLYPAMTIHRFLKWNKESNKFSINEYNKSSAKFVIIDEASMVDISLFDSLFRGLSVDTKIILIGDYNQLPSVGPGQVLKDIIDSKFVDVCYLDKLHRQKEGSNIIDLAYSFNDGNIDKNIFNKDEDLTFVETDDIAFEIKKISKNFVNIDYKDFQVLAPMYKTIYGIDNLNKILQNIFNSKDKNKKEIKLEDIIYRENDKVLQLTNMPEDNVFNGDIGIIHEIKNKEIIIDFDGNLVKYTPSTYKNFKHGYVISIHKSQGSEFDNVILLVNKSYSKMLYRKLYYTAITRSKKNLIILGSIDALYNASINNTSTDRKTTLKQKLEKQIKNE